MEKEHLGLLFCSVMMKGEGGGIHVITKAIKNSLCKFILLSGNKIHKSNPWLNMKDFKN